jgi:predicted permease
MSWRRFFRRSRKDAELQEEIRSYLEEEAAENMAGGMSADEARRQARIKLGNPQLVRETLWRQNTIGFVESAWRDVKHAGRTLLRTPGFTATVLVTLALGIGANLAVFQLLNSVILAKLPVVRPEELVVVDAAKTPFDQSWTVSYAAYERLRASIAKSVPLAARTGFEEAILQLSHGDPQKARYEFVSENYFGVLGVQPAAGRLFVQADAAENRSEWPAVVRYDFAQDHFSTVQQALGMHIHLNGVPVVIIGVTDRRFEDMLTGYAPDFWLPLEAETARLGMGFDSLGPGHGIDLDRSWLNQPGIFWLTLVARIPAGQRQSVAAWVNQAFRADRELMAEAIVDPAAKAAALRASVAMIPADRGLGGFRRQSSQPLFLLMALSASIFLVGCLNLANLQLARLSARAHELGIRMALGASRWRLIGQVLAEDAILMLLGGGAAFLVGRTASSVLVHWASSRGSLLNINLRPNLNIAALGVGLMVVAMLAFSVLPAMYFIRASLAGTAGSRAKVLGLSQIGLQRWRANTILAAQVSLSLVLTVMSACFAATLVHWEKVDVGMDREHILSVYVDMRRTGYITQHHDWTGLYRQIRQRVEAVPGVRAAAVEMCPMPNCGWNTALYVFGRGGLSNAQVHGEEDHVGPGFFTTMGIPLLQGRDFSETDTDTAKRVAIVSRSYARQLFGGESPIGRWVGYEPAPNDHQFLIVGEVADAQLDGPQRDAPPAVYMSINQHPFPIHTIEVRVTGDPAQIADRIRATIQQIDASLPITEIIPLTVELNDGLGPQKLLARLASVYAGLTLLLVGIGFYGVMSFRTSRRKSEFGIRLALGASRRQIRMLILKQTANILLTGIVPGLLLSVLAVHLARPMIVGSSSGHWAAVAGGTVVLTLAGLIATIIPSLRAALADPLEILRSE